MYGANPKLRDIIYMKQSIANVPISNIAYVCRNDEVIFQVIKVLSNIQML